MNTVLEAFGAFILFGGVGALLLIATGHRLTSAHDKRQIGGIDMSWYAGAVFLGILVGSIAATVVITKAVT